MIFLKRCLFLTLILLLSTQITGCSSHYGAKLPKDSPYEKNIPETEYDPTILAYRFKDSGPVIRDSSGKKVRTEEELIQFKKAKLKDIDNQKKKAVPFIAAAIIYAPYTIVIGIIDGIVSSPWNLMVKHYKKKTENTAEKYYFSGRGFLDNKEYDRALADLEYALFIMPSLRSQSDIDYWRGFALEGKGKIGESQYAYLMFIEFSEKNTAKYFREKHNSEPSWSYKAKKALTKINSNKR